MSSSDRGRDDAPGTQREPAPPTGTRREARTRTRNWLDRMQRARARQAAITRNLYTWSNYKNWADQVRDSWKADRQARRQPPRQTQEIAFRGRKLRCAPRRDQALMSAWDAAARHRLRTTPAADRLPVANRLAGILRGSPGGAGAAPAGRASHSTSAPIAPRLPAPDSSSSRARRCQARRRAGSSASPGWSRRSGSPGCAGSGSAPGR